MAVMWSVDWGVVSVICCSKCLACDGSVVHVGETGCGKADDFRGRICDASDFVFVWDGQHAEEAGGTVQQDGLNYAFAKQQQEVGATDSTLRSQIRCSLCLWNAEYTKKIAENGITQVKYKYL